MKPIPSVREILIKSFLLIFGLALAIFVLAWGMVSLAEASEPPARFNHPHANLIIEQRGFHEVDPICRDRFPSAHFPPATKAARILGCAEIGDGERPCRITLPVRGTVADGRWQMIFRHERAHCNGWPQGHPQ